MYSRLDAFLGFAKDLSDIVDYDFKNEAHRLEIRLENDPIEKFLKYKKFGRFDCDNSNGTCLLMNDIYYKLWRWSYNSRFTIDDELKKAFGNMWRRLGADTMNSYQTTYTNAKSIYKSVRENELMLQFAKYTHTIGNFTLIPFNLEGVKYFNTYRCARFKDYFDLSLKYIKEQVDEDTFKNYIDIFFLNDYVDGEYNVLPLFSRHNDYLSQERMIIDNVNLLIPQNETELNEFLKNVIDRIQNRGKKIAKKLIELQ